MEYQNLIAEIKFLYSLLPFQCNKNINIMFLRKGIFLPGIILAIQIIFPIG